MAHRPGRNDKDDDEEKQAPLRRQDDGYVNFNEGLDKYIEVRNSVPPPRNPNRDDSGSEDDL